MLGGEYIPDEENVLDEEARGFLWNLKYGDSDSSFLLNYDEQNKELCPYPVPRWFANNPDVLHNVAKRAEERKGNGENPYKGKLDPKYYDVHIEEKERVEKAWGMPDGDAYENRPDQHYNYNNEIDNDQVFKDFYFLF